MIAASSKHSRFFRPPCRMPAAWLIASACSVAVPAHVNAQTREKTAESRIVEEVIVTAPDVASYDLDRIEILRGPQGTLYGASALNGVVRVLTHDADLRDLSVKMRTSISTTEEGGGNYGGDVAYPEFSTRVRTRTVGAQLEYRF